MANCFYMAVCKNRPSESGNGMCTFYLVAFVCVKDSFYQQIIPANSSMLKSSVRSLHSLLFYILQWVTVSDIYLIHVPRRNKEHFTCTTAGTIMVHGEKHMTIHRLVNRPTHLRPERKTGTLAWDTWVTALRQGTNGPILYRGGTLLEEPSHWHCFKSVSNDCLIQIWEENTHRAELVHHVGTMIFKIKTQHKYIIS